MATLVSSISCKYVLSAYFLYAYLLFSLKKGYAFEGRKIAESHHHQHSHTIQVSSLLPSTSCKTSTKVPDKRPYLEVVHKHGPCYEQNKDKANATTLTEILLQDQSRVNLIHSRLSKTSVGNNVRVTDATTLPAKDGSTLGTGNYIVTVGLGTPKKALSLIFDTGSDITWTQCQPCVRSCYQQQEPIFDPTQSTSYSNVSCASSACSSLRSATGKTPGCSSSTCIYGIQYGDSSFSIGFFAKERLTLTRTDIINDFYFGCGENNQGLFVGAAGLLGLGRSQLSLVSQTAQQYKKLFSYCLPSSASSTGFLTFGGSPSTSVKYTPLSTTTSGTPFYGLDITGISVGGQKLAISNSVFSAAGAVIDSGTVITRLPPAAYSSLRSAFRQLMSKYPTARPISILDTCYDFSSYTTVSVPKISFFFNGGVEVDLDVNGILYVVKANQVCLAFAGNSDANDAAIFGNVQQKTLEVVYDGMAEKVGFASGGCK